MKVITALHARQVIQELQAVSMTLDASLYANTPWLKLIAQLNDPQHVRPVKPIDADIIDRSVRFIPNQGVWEQRDVSQVRGRAKPTEYTKKMSVSLLPADAGMQPFRPLGSDDVVSIIFDIRDCNTKNEKYVYPADIQSNTKWWLSRHSHKDFRDLHYPSPLTLDVLRQLLVRFRADNKIMHYNELLIGLSKKAVIGIFCHCDDLFSRLNGLRIKRLLHAMLDIDLPIFILHDNVLQRSYDAGEIEQDLLELASRVEADTSDSLYDDLQEALKPENQWHFSFEDNIATKQVVGRHSVKIGHIYQRYQTPGVSINGSLITGMNASGQPLVTHHTQQVNLWESCTVNLYNAHQLLADFLTWNFQAIASSFESERALQRVISNLLQLMLLARRGVTLNHPYNNYQNALDKIAEMTMQSSDRLQLRADSEKQMLWSHTLEQQMVLRQHRMLVTELVVEIQQKYSDSSKANIPKRASNVLTIWQSNEIHLSQKVAQIIEMIRHHEPHDLLHSFSFGLFGSNPTNDLFRKYFERVNGGNLIERAPETNTSFAYSTF